MTDCKLCCEDFDETNQCTIVYNIDDNCIKELSAICLDCLGYLKKNILGNLLTTIAKETCEASIKRIMKADLPTHLTIDGTGRGQKIDKILINNKVISTELESNISKEEIDLLNKKIGHIRELIENDNDMFLYEKNAVFEKYL